MCRGTAIVVVMVLCGAHLVFAVEPPRLMNYQGVLRDSAGTPLTGTYAMTIRLFESETGGDAVYEEQQPAVGVSGGLFSLRIGTYGFLPRPFAEHTDLYLELEVAGEVLAPRTPLAAVGYAFNARYVNGVYVAASDRLELFVDAALGNDDYSGLFPWAPKQTIQGAVDRIPTILEDDVIVHIEPGTYAETVRLYDRDFRGDHSITLIGEEAGVLITGERLREYGIEIRNVRSFMLENLEIADTSSYNVLITDSTGILRSCTLTTLDGTPVGRGLLMTRSFVTTENTTISEHALEGVVCSSAARCFLDDVVITGNLRGMDVLKAGQVRFVGPATVTGNSIGCRAFGHGEIDFSNRSDVHVTGNTTADLSAQLLSVIFAYGNADVGSCVAADNSVCSSTY